MEKTSGPAERLRAINALLENAPHYRAAFARTSFINGTIALCVALALHFAAQTHAWISYTYSRPFAAIWLAVLIVTLVVQALLFRRVAAKNAPASEELSLIVRAAAPALVIPAAVTIWFFNQGFLGNSELSLVMCWIAFYGLALLTNSFWAPRSIAYLGWALLFTALFIPTLMLFLDDIPSHLIPNILMGMTFGLYHLLYALMAWQSQRR